MGWLLRLLLPAGEVAESTNKMESPSCFVPTPYRLLYPAQRFLPPLFSSSPPGAGEGAPPPRPPPAVRKHKRKSRRDEGRRGGSRGGWDSEEVQAQKALVVELKELGRLKQWRRVLDIMQDNEAAMNDIVFSTGITQLGKCGRCSEAVALMEEGGGRFKCSLMARTTVLRCCARAGRKADALLVLEGLRQDSGMDEIGYGVALDAAARLGAPDAAMSILGDMRRRNIPLNAVMGSAAISCLGRAGRLEDVLALTSELQSTGVANLIVYNACIDACAKSGHASAAEKILSVMVAAGLTPDVTSYNCVINAAGKQGDWKRAMKLLDSMRQAGLEPNEVSFTSAMGAARHNRQAKKLVERMKEDGVGMDEGMYVAAMARTAGDGRMEETLSLLDQAESDGLPLSLPMIHCAMDACAKAGKFSKASAFMDKLQRGGLSPTVTTYTILLAAASKAGNRLPKVLQLLAEMQGKGLQPDFLTYNYALAAAAKVPAADTALKLLDDMKGTPGCQPNIISYSLCISALGRNQRPKEGLLLFRNMQVAGIVPDERSYQILMDTCRAGMSRQELIFLVNEQKQRGLLSDRRRLAEILDGES